MSNTVISYPIPPYQNLPIDADFYQPSRFVISAITLGRTTTVTTSVDNNYVIGQQVRLIIPDLFGSTQLNEAEGYVLSLPSTTQVVLDIDSSLNVDTFIANPYSATITNMTTAAQMVVTASNTILKGNNFLITGVTGMIDPFTTVSGVNNLVFTSPRRSTTTITLNLDSTHFSAYTSGGTISLYGIPIYQPQILAIGDVNSGIISSTGVNLPSTNIPGSFINISPN